MSAPATPAFHDNAQGFVRNVLGAIPDPWQAEALDIISKYPRLAIRSGHDVGKTALLSWVAIWFSLTRTEALVPLVANTQAQLRDVTWAELRAGYAACHLTWPATSRWVPIASPSRQPAP